MAEAERYFKAYVRLRSATTGRWFVDQELRPKLVAEAAEKGTSMTEVIVMILCDKLGLTHVPSGRRTAAQPDEELLNLRLPGYVYGAVRRYADETGYRPYQDAIREILCEHYGLKATPAREREAAPA